MSENASVSTARRQYLDLFTAEPHGGDPQSLLALNAVTDMVAIGDISHDCCDGGDVLASPLNETHRCCGYHPFVNKSMRRSVIDVEFLLIPLRSYMNAMILVTQPPLSTHMKIAVSGASPRAFADRVGE